jgi:hypothetical protein
MTEAADFFKGRKASRSASRDAAQRAQDKKLAYGEFFSARGSREKGRYERAFCARSV